MADNNKNTPLTPEEADDIRVTLETDEGNIECRVITISKLITRITSHSYH